MQPTIDYLEIPSQKSKEMKMCRSIKKTLYNMSVLNMSAQHYHTNDDSVKNYSFKNAGVNI